MTNDKCKMTNDSSLPLLTRDPSANNHDWKRDFYVWLPLSLLSWLLAWKFQDQFISDWDGFDYTSYAVQGWPTSLGLGRALFLGYNHLLWRLANEWFNTPAEQAYMVLRYAVIAQSGPATVGIYALCKELTASRHAAGFGALLVAISPYYIIYSGRGMSEIPAFLMLSWSLWWMLRSLRLGRAIGFLIAALLVGLSANLREFAIFYLPFIPLAASIYGYGWIQGLKALALAGFGALAGMIFWTLYQPTYLAGVLNWYALSAQERKFHPVTIDNFRFLFNFAYNCSSVVLIIAPLALVWLWPRKNLRALFVLGALGLLADLVLLANHDLPVNSRYLLTGLLGLAAICGWCLAELIKCHRVRALPLMIGLVVLSKGAYNQMFREVDGSEWAARAAKNYISRIEALPWNSAFIVGARSPLVSLYYWIGARPFWKTVSPGSGWPDERLGEVIDDLLLSGRMVYVDFDPDLWQWGSRKQSREGPGLEMIKREYELAQVKDHFYRILKRKKPQAWPN
jgi:Dolichyl-phosphate-mannose-protein mannosyltransferase